MKNGERLGLDLDRDLGDEWATAGLLPCFLRDTHIPAVLTWTCECAPDKYEWSPREPTLMKADDGAWAWVLVVRGLKLCSSCCMWLRELLEEEEEVGDLCNR